MIARRQPPVYSPVTLRALLSGIGQILHLGPDPRPLLREQLRRRFKRADVVLCGCGTEALRMALRLAQQGVSDSQAVALPAYTCFDVAAAAVGERLLIALYDLDPSTLSPDLDSLKRCLDAGARMVIVAPLYGVPVDWDGVESCLAPYGAVAIEDAAQGHGASWRGRPLGSLGALGVLSFGRGKGWTGGRGGALLLSADVGTRGVSESGWQRSELAVLAAEVAQWALGRPSVYALPASIPWLRLGETFYRAAPQPGNLTRTAAAALASTFVASAIEAKRRRTNGARLLSALKRSDHVQPICPTPGGTPGFLRLPVRVSRGLGGFTDVQRLLRLGVAPGYPSGLADLPPVRARLANPNERLPGATELVGRLITLPTHSRLREKEREEVLRQVNTYE